MPRETCPWWASSVAAASIHLGLFVGSTLRVPFLLVPTPDAPGNKNVSPSNVTLVLFSSSDGTFFPSRSADTKAQVPWSFSRSFLAASSLGASAATSSPTTRNVSACSLMANLQKKQGPPWASIRAEAGGGQQE